MHTVYWSCAPLTPLPISNDDMSLLYVEPVPVYKKVLDEVVNMNIVKTKRTAQYFFNCPAFKQTIRNTFAILAPIDLTMSLTPTELRVKELNQREFDLFINVRSLEDKFIGLNTGLLLFSEKSVNMTAYSAFLSKGDVARKTRIIHGTYNISKWFRP